MIVLVAPSSSFLFLLKTILSVIITVFALRFSSNKKSLERRRWKERRKKKERLRDSQKKEKNENGVKLI